MAEHLLDVPSEIDATIDEQWRRLGQPGTWLTGRERVAVVEAARTAGRPVPVAPRAFDDAARLVSRGAATITSNTVDQLEAAGIDRDTYVEIVGVVSRAAAIDTFELGVGRPLRPLPSAVDGEPARERVDEARRRAGWVATVGAIRPPTALTSVAREAADQEVLHGALYLSYAGMGDLDADRGLHRTQMELVAARVSLLNDCHY